MTFASNETRNGWRSPAGDSIIMVEAPKKKPMAKSRTVLAAFATVVAYLVVKHAGFPPEIATDVGLIGAAFVAMFMRSGIEDAKS